MSCNCEQTNTINCTTCNNACNECSCPVETTFMPETTTCSEPSECSEIYPAQCVIYEGPTLQCSLESVNNYPDITHTLISSNSTNNSLESALQNINSMFCYLFSKDYIARMLTLIRDDESDYDLKTLFCQITCDEACTLTCPANTQVSYTYVSYSSGTLNISFQAISGNPLTRHYKIKAYRKNNTGGYDYYNTTTITSAPFPTTSITVNLSTGTLLNTDEWLITIKVYEPGNENGCYSGVDYGNINNLIYNPQICGVAITSPVVLSCCTNNCLCVSGVTFTLNNSTLTFNFNYLNLSTFSTNNWFSPISYLFHWYKKTTSGATSSGDIYTYIGHYEFTQSASIGSNNVITSSYINGEQYVLLLQVKTNNLNCYQGLPLRLNGTYTGAELNKINCNIYYNS